MHGFCGKAAINGTMTQNAAFPRRWRAILGTEFVRYFLASLLALLVDLGVFSLSLRLTGVPWAIAAGLGFCAGALTAWWLSIRFVFRNRTLQKKPSAEFTGFLVIGILGLGVTEAVIWSSIHILNVMPEFGKLMAAGATFVFNFLLRKLFLFRRQS